MLKKWLGAWGTDYQRGCLVRLLAVVIVVPLFAAFILVPLYFANRPGVSSEEAVWMMAVPAVLFLVVILGGGAGFVFVTIRRRENWLDAVFLPLGLMGRSYAMIGRQYHGKLNGRDVDVFFSRGPLLRIYLGTTIKTQLSISAAEDVSSNLAGFFKKLPLELDDPRLAGFAHEPGWGQNFVDQPEVKLISAGLIFEEHSFLFRQLVLNPGAIMFRLYRSKQIRDFRFTPGQGQHWLEQLAALVKIAEGLPAPKEDLDESEFVQKTRRGNLRTGWITGIIVTALIGIPTCIAIVTVLVILIFSGGL